VTSSIERNLRVSAIGAELSGSLWMPASGASAVVLMIPGSGRSTRHNDDYFPAIRNHLVDSGIGVASFDKRGSGRSTGSFHHATIEKQVDDAWRCLAAIRGALPDVPLGVFGHSQGGWVAYELAANNTAVTTLAEVEPLSFAVSNSGPAVGPAEQELDRLTRPLDPTKHADFQTTFSRIVAVAEQGQPYTKAASAIRESAFESVLESYLVEGPTGWQLLRSLLTYQPAPAIQAATVPVLVVHGAHDEMVPVQASLQALASFGNPHVQAEVIPDVDHRLLDTSGQLPERYLQLVSRFIAEAC